MSKWLSEWVSKWVSKYVCMYACMHACMCVCMDGWMDGWMDVRTCVCMYVCMHVTHWHWKSYHHPQWATLTVLTRHHHTWRARNPSRQCGSNGDTQHGSFQGTKHVRQPFCWSQNQNCSQGIETGSLSMHETSVVAIPWISKFPLVLVYKSWLQVNR